MTPAHKPPIITPPTPTEWQQFPKVSRYITDHAGRLPDTHHRDHAARQKQLDTLARFFGRLALVSLKHDDLTGELFSRELADLARELIPAQLAPVLTASRPPYTVNLKQGDRRGLHAHLIAPLSCMPTRLQTRIRKAPSGTGGGLLLAVPSGTAHVVLTDDTPDDLERVARYISRYPDERLDDPGNPARRPLVLAGFESLLTRQEQKKRAARMGWEQNTRGLYVRV